RTAFLEVVTRHACLGGRLAAVDCGASEQLFDRLLRRRLLAGSSCGGLRFDLDLEARLCRMAGRENRFGGDIESDEEQAVPQYSAGDLVEFEGVHLRQASGVGAVYHVVAAQK